MEEIQNYMISLFSKAYISDTFDPKKEFIIIPKGYTENCPYDLLINIDDFKEILIKSREQNPLSEAILLNISNMAETALFDIISVYIAIPNLFNIYANKCQEYTKDREQVNSFIQKLSSNLEKSNPLTLTDFTDLDTLNITTQKEETLMTPEKLNTYTENINTILKDITTLSNQNTLFDILSLDIINTSEEIANLKDVILSLLPYCTNDEKGNLIELLIKPIFTQELDTDDVVKIYTLLGFKLLEVQDTTLINKLFNPFLKTLYSTTDKED